MSVNWQLGLQQGNRVEGVYNAFRQGREQAGQRMAAGALATGDTQGALSAYGRMGNAEGVLAVQDRQRAEQDRQTALQRQGVQDQRQAVQDKYAGARFQNEQDAAGRQQMDGVRENLVRVATALRLAPEEQRTGMYTAQAVPLLQQLKVPDAEIQRVLADGHLTNEELDQFLAQMGGDPSGFQTDHRVLQQGGGIYDVETPYGGAPKVNTLQGPIDGPNADLERELLQVQIEAQRALSGQRGRSNQGHATGGGSGGGGGGNGGGRVAPRERTYGR